MYSWKLRRCHGFQKVGTLAVKMIIVIAIYVKKNSTLFFMPLKIPAVMGYEMAFMCLWLFVHTKYYFKALTWFDKSGQSKQASTFYLV